MKNQEIIYPKEVQEFLEDTFDITDKEEIISEIDFATCKIDENTSKKVFNFITYSIEDG